MLVEIPVRFIAVHFNDNRVVQPDFKMAWQSHAHAPVGAVMVKIGISFQGKIDLGSGIIPVLLVSSIPVGRGMAGWTAVIVRLAHRNATGRINITGWEKKREKSPDQNGKKSLRVFHVFPL